MYKHFFKLLEVSFDDSITTDETPTKNFKLVSDEKQSVGSIGWSTYKAYVKAGGGLVHMHSSKSY